MKDTEKVLKEELSAWIKGHGQRLTMLSKLIISMLKLSTICYSKLSLVLNPKVKKASNFKRIQRFMKGFSFCRRAYIQFVWRLFVPSSKGSRRWVALSIDRTNWKFGKQNINILLIGISYRGTAIPLVWKLLDKRGNSSARERIELVDDLLECLDESQQGQLKCLLADREFIGKEWFSYLRKQPFTFVIRIRNNSLVRKIGKSHEVHVRKLFGSTSFRVLRKKRVLFGHQLYLGGQRLSEKEFLILVSDRPLSHGRQFYGERWGIEVFFAACKSRGFNFEDTHVTKLERLANLIFLIALAFVWALKTGEWLYENGHRIPIKKLKNRKARLFSIFRIGLDHLKERLLNFLIVFKEIRLLSCT